MARGREALLEVVHLHNETTHAVEVVAILGTSASESGAREWEQIVARTGMSHFVLFTYPGTQGAEPRIKRAIHAKTETHAKAESSTIATNPQSIAALQSHHGAPARTQPARH